MLLEDFGQFSGRVALFRDRHNTILLQFLSLLNGEVVSSSGETNLSLLLGSILWAVRTLRIGRSAQVVEAESVLD